MRIMVTGAAGFIGSHVAEAYLAAGHQVLVIDNLTSGRRANIPARAGFEEMDIRDRRLGDVCRRFQPQVVCHHAAQIDVRKSVTDPMFDAEVNVVGTLNLLEAARAAGAERFIFASSGGAIYGEQEDVPATETHALSPISPYGVSKLAAEKYLYYYRAVHGLSYVALRYANVYGPRQDPFGEAGVVAIFASKLLGNERPIINGDGLQTRDYVYVADVARANLLALAPGVEGVFNIGTGRETGVVTLFEELQRLTGQEGNSPHGPAKAGEQRRSVLDATLAARTLGWRSEVGLAEGLKATVEYFRQGEGARSR
ncbi:MAG: NAD-dependent epimerase/dehydratase family protein [Pseudomonadota bacterium]